MSATVVYRRHLGPVESLSAGEWTEETVTGRPAICCGSCAGIYDVPETHRIEPDGFIVPAIRCGIGPCPEFGYIRLLNYSDPVVPA